MQTVNNWAEQGKAVLGVACGGVLATGETVAGTLAELWEALPAAKSRLANGMAQVVNGDVDQLPGKLANVLDVPWEDARLDADSLLSLALGYAVIIAAALLICLIIHFPSVLYKMR